MVSLEKRFNGNSQEVLNYTKTWGMWKAMYKYGVRDSIAMRRWLTKKTGDENYGTHTTLSTSNGAHNGSWADQLLEAFLHKVSAMETKNERLEQEIELLRTKLDYYETQEKGHLENKAALLLERCKA